MHIRTRREALSLKNEGKEEEHGMGAVTAIAYLQFEPRRQNVVNKRPDKYAHRAGFLGLIMKLISNTNIFGIFH